MNTVFVDLHIHTSDDPNNLNRCYDIDTLIENVEKISDCSPYLISFTDHNTINKIVYLKAVEKNVPLILGAELHIEYHKSREPYHCHIYFNLKVIDSQVIDNLNNILDELYPNKQVSFGDENIPHLERIVTAFDAFDFMLLPHGGQSHHTFNKSIPDGVIFDTTIERSIYYNQFDGFTARSNSGLAETQDYFKKLGINDFVNLMTCSDNYVPSNYPDSKGKDASKFVPTWMLSEPSFSGLRLSLSESSRLIYGEKPQNWSEFIQKVILHNDSVEIDVDLSPGLNVVIGGSSSGKTLFVDSIYRKIADSFEVTEYSEFGVDKIHITNVSGVQPHYIPQNYIVQIVNQAEGKTINEIEIIRKVFPDDEEVTKRIETNLANLKEDLNVLMASVKKFEETFNELKRVPILPRLIRKDERSLNVFRPFIPDGTHLEKIDYAKHEYDEHNKSLLAIENFIKDNVFAVYKPETFDEIRRQLNRAYEGSLIEKKIREVINYHKKEVDEKLTEEDAEQQSKEQNYDKLLRLTTNFSRALDSFDTAIKKLSYYSVNIQSQEIQVMGHTLYIENNFQIDPEKLRETFNRYLKSAYRIESIKTIRPYELLQERFSKKSPKVIDYENFISRVYSDFEDMNKTQYRIITSVGKNFESLSAGWKTSILLDLILGYEGDFAPLIIDQPEDNLATYYINHGLISAVKKIKDKKQIILVSHNATIPMLGDAQTVVVCENKDGKITIKSNPLEGSIGDRSIVDHIAEITDGGKSSIKKRVKKYNLKSFRG